MSKNILKGKWCRLLWLASATVSIGCSPVASSPAIAQIVPDTTLPNNSVVNFSNSTTTIAGGTTAGRNLFHSFKEFSIPTGNTAYFNNAPTIGNIISRVTGASGSNIDGLLKANGSANLFLINPNGIIFGPNARLEIGGSFLASTASSLKFADGKEFSATNPHQPLLTISTPIGLQFGGTPGQIVVQQSNLAVAQDLTLALVGGDMTLAGGQLAASGGRIELGSVAGTGMVSLNPTAKGYALGYAGVANFQDIQLSQAASVDTSGIGGGDIQVQGRRLTLTDGSRLLALTLGAQPAGKIAVNTSESVEITGTGNYDQSVRNFVTGNVSPNDLRNGLFTVSLGAGPSGEIAINTRQFIGNNGALVAATTFGPGPGGNVMLNASEKVTLSASFVATGTTNVGNSGNLTINTGEWSASDNAVAVTSSFGGGKAGDLSVNASKSVELIGSTPIQILPNVRVFTAFFTSTLGAGNAGNLQVNTERLVVRDGAGLAATTFAQGSGGNITINASKLVELTGNSPNGETVSSLTALTEPGSTGQGGNLTINTGQLIVRNGAAISTETATQGRGGNLTVHATDSVELSGSSADGQRYSSLVAQTRGSGAAGNITIDTGKLIVRDGAQISAQTESVGAGGNLTVNARDSVELIGSPIPINNINQVSGIFADSDPSNGGTNPSLLNTPAGPAGNVTINTGKLIVRNGAEIGAGTFGKGQGGDITVHARESVEAIGVSPDDLKFPSNLYVDAYADGNAGKMTITTGRLIVRDGAQISSGSFGRGNGGSVSVNARESVELSGSSPVTQAAGPLFFSVDERFPSGVITNSVGAGAAGDVTITTRKLTISNGAVAAVSSQGSGNAGNLEVAARSILLSNQGAISATTASGEGGDIRLQARDYLLLRKQSQINTTAQGTGNGGNITINTPFTVAVPSENSDIVANAFQGRGGNINITTQGIYGLKFRPNLTPKSDITASSQFGVNGTVQINTPGIDPSRGLATLPENIVDVSRLVASGCVNRGVGESEFIVTGRGGLPPNPNEAISGEATWVDLRPRAARLGSRGTGQRNLSPISNSPKPTPQLVEAQGWVINSKGQVVLVAQAPTVTPTGPGSHFHQCYVP